MRRTAQTFLIIGAIGLLLYPLWGLLYPDAYSAELVAHYSHAPGFSDSQVRKTACVVFVSNAVLALAFILLVAYLSNIARAGLAVVTGILLIFYPFVRTAGEAWGGIILSSHVSEAAVSASFSTEKLIYVAFGMAIMGISSGISKRDKSGRLTH